MPADLGTLKSELPNVRSTKALAECEYARAREEKGDLEGAVAGYKGALQLNPLLRVARRRLSVVLVQIGRKDEAVASIRTELRDKCGEEWFTNLITKAMESPDLALAGDLAGLLAAIQRGSEWYGYNSAEAPCALPDAMISLPKLRHDVDQFRLLRQQRLLDDSFETIIRGYMETIDLYAGVGNASRTPLTSDDERRIGRAYGRIVYRANIPRLPSALSLSWNRETAQRLYCKPPGVVIIDDFLNQQALDGLYHFCLESTIWFGNRYANGRLGAFFFSGFNCPLLLQIAEEIQAAFPLLIGPSYPLRQLWAFKNTCELPAHSTIHADFAAANVNFWITPTSENLDPSSGGMLIYNVSAPLSWDFVSYNERTDLIRDFLTEHQPGVIRIPYRQNRAIIFNSDLFHATEAVRFRPDYRSHRINVTLLYGERKHDQYHPPKLATASSTYRNPKRWRSAAFTRSRK